MSACISRYGEFGDHDPLDDDFYCTRCGVLDEAAMRRGVEAAVREKVAQEIEDASTQTLMKVVLDRWGTSLSGRRTMSPHRAGQIVKLCRADAAGLVRRGASRGE